MKRILFLLFLFLSILPIHSKEDHEVLYENKPQEEKTSNEAEKEYNFKPVKINTKAQVSPKNEHRKLVRKVNKSLEKDKINFQKRKENELRLLNIEYNILEFHP